MLLADTARLSIARVALRRELAAAAFAAGTAAPLWRWCAAAVH
jgi:hypothetical protein